MISRRLLLSSRVVSRWEFVSKLYSALRALVRLLLWRTSLLIFRSRLWFLLIIKLSPPSFILSFVNFSPRTRCIILSPISITTSRKPILLAPILILKKIPLSMMKLTVCVTPPQFHYSRVQTLSSWLRFRVFMVLVRRIITRKCPCISRKPAIPGR